MYAQDVMTTRIISVRPKTTIREVANLLVLHKISAVPVISFGRLLGAVGENDLLHRVEISTENHIRTWWRDLFTTSTAIARDYVKCHSSYVEDVMNINVTTVSSTTTLADIADLLEAGRVKWLPVLENNRVTGIVTRSDLVRALASKPVLNRSFMRADSTIQDDVISSLRDANWTISGSTRVTVSDGIVLLEGTYRCEAERKASAILAENIRGVRLVDDRREFLDLSFAAF